MCCWNFSTSHSQASTDALKRLSDLFTDAAPSTGAAPSVGVVVFGSEFALATAALTATPSLAACASFAPIGSELETALRCVPCLGTVVLLAC